MLLPTKWLLLMLLLLLLFVLLAAALVIMLVFVLPPPADRDMAPSLSIRLAHYIHHIKKISTKR